MRGDVVTITFATTRHDHAGGESYRAMTVRVVLPTAGARSLAELLFDFLRARGFDPAPRPADARVQ